jgi:para-aminobenzoate synthetase/4-amino-4-deoxychorismate lyase
VKVKERTGGAPFVLLEDARPSAAAPARLFARPRDVIVAHTLAEVAPALEAVRAGLKRGLYAAGWLSYEAGCAFEPRLAARARVRAADAPPLLWLGLFERVELIENAALAQALPDADGAWLSAPRPRMPRAIYDDAFARTQHYIRAGDVYQINLSYRADVTLLGDPLAAYAQIRDAGQGGWSAAVHDGARWLLSTSPELFFRLSAEGVIEARPMKGTAARAQGEEQDRRAAERLQSDPKERAENVMIVDLLRNDISRIAKRGSVRTPELFSVETYPTLHALTSTVHAEIRDDCDAIDALKALFPCGSITGAPKIRAMEIIDELECGQRGAYTGSIGWMAPDGAAEFNVAIRTLALADGRAELGLGSGVVVDSTLEGEWRECAAKGAFVTAGQPRFDLIETMRFEPGAGVVRLDLHLARLERSARTFDFAFDGAALRDALRAALVNAEPCRVRLVLSSSGDATITTSALPAFDTNGARVSVAPLPVDPQDFRLRHKTTLRDFYDGARAAAGANEVIFIDPDGFVTEGSFTNVFVERGGVLLTPPASRGLLPGVLRAELLANARAREADLRLADLQGGFLLGNSLRGLVEARLVALAPA